MKYLVCRKQQGEGCDYTIGCGMRYEIVECDDDNAVADSILKDILYPDGVEEYCVQNGEFGLEEVIICGIGANDFYRRYDAGTLDYFATEFIKPLRIQQEREAEIEQEKADLAEFERLKKKLGK